MNFDTYLKGTLNADPELRVEYDKLTPKYEQISRSLTAESLKIHLYNNKDDKRKTHYAHLLFPVVPLFYFPARRCGKRTLRIYEDTSTILKRLALPITYYYSVLYYSERDFLIKILLEV
ncbi:MAG: hypothetical protein IJ341_02865 [Bacteroidales bacterium]|nr:hypothetical protein [Bacteroidales bacterium]